MIPLVQKAVKGLFPNARASFLTPDIFAVASSLWPVTFLLLCRVTTIAKSVRERNQVTGGNISHPVQYFARRVYWEKRVHYNVSKILVGSPSFSAT